VESVVLNALGKNAPSGAKSNRRLYMESSLLTDHTRVARRALFIAGIIDAPVTGTAVVVDSSGEVGVAPSSARFKDEIKPMDKASEAILALRPVRFHYKTDTKETPQFGLIAEEVAKVNPALVLPDKEGKPYTVRYDAVNAMLLNEFLKWHRKNEQQESKIEQQDAKIARQQKQIEALTAGLQKVSAQLELSKAAPQTAENNQ
jgi:hypothetical protein